MKKKVVLPFNDKPYSLMYHGSAFPLGIIQGNTTNDLTPWLSSKYINCWFAPTWGNKFAYYVTDHWATGDKILTQQRIDLCSNEYKAIFNSNIIYQFKKMMDLGYYPHGAYNEEYIPGKKYFQKEYHIHDFLLIGYNEINKYFISVGYLRDDKFQRYKIPYDYMNLAITTHKTQKISLNFWKYNEKATFDLDFDRLITELSDYIASTTSVKIFKENRTWGLNAIIALGNHIANMCNNESYIDHRYTRGIMEHKVFMQSRIEFLLDKQYIKDRIYLDYSNKVLHLAECGHLLSLKFLVNKKQNIANKINDIYIEIVKLEREYLPDLLADLRKFAEVNY